MTKHTAGNWKIGNASSVVTDVRRDREHTEIDERSILFYGGELICESIENKSDASLIAAAPELLEALEIVTRDLHEAIYIQAVKTWATEEIAYKHATALTEKYRVLIAKAKGE